MKYALRAAALSLAASFSFTTAASAAIPAGPTEGSLTTFIDTNTGLEWLRLDNFFNASLNQMVTAANAQGFTFATEAQVHTLLNTLPLNAGQWSADASVMGSAPNRALMWGAYDDGGNPYGWAFSFNGDTAWSFANDQAQAGAVQNANSDSADMNVWAFRVAGSVPEPATWAMMLLGFAGIGAVMRARRKPVLMQIA